MNSILVEGRLDLTDWMDERQHDYDRCKHVLNDIQYVLSSTPNNPGKSWSANMRKNFVKGVQALINLIDKIQLADPQARQTGAHVEYESRNWYCVFNLDR